MHRTVLLPLAALLLLGGCAAKEFTAPAMSRPGDENLSCTEIRQQILDNNAAADVFLRKDKNVEAGNTAKTIASAIPYVGILVAASNDLSNEEQVKARALADRNEQLGYLAKQKGCTE